MSIDNPELEKLTRLSEREVEVLQCKCDGFVEKQIADKLIISTNTVKNHLAHIYEKLEIDTLTRTQRAYRIPNFCVHIPTVLKIREESRKDANTNVATSESQNITVTAVSEEDEGFDPGISPTAIIAVLEDELYLAQRSMALPQRIEPPVIGIPSYQSLEQDNTPIKGRWIVAAIFLGLMVGIGVILGIGGTLVFLGGEQNGQEALVNPTPTILVETSKTPAESTPIISTTGTIETFPIQTSYRTVL